MVYTTLLIKTEFLTLKKDFLDHLFEWCYNIL